MIEEHDEDCISKQAVFDVLRGTNNDWLFEKLKMLPSVTTAEKTGHWKPYDGSWYECSECGAIREAVGFFENYCPNCGAKMTEEEKNGR